MSKNLPANASIGASGEHLVLSNLLKLNFVAGLAPQNTKDYDLIASNLNGDKLINIQVKTAVTLDKSFKCDGMWKMLLANVNNPKSAHLGVVKTTKDVEIICNTKISWLTS